MDSANDLTMSVAKSSRLCELGWGMFVPYVKSLEMAGFKGTKLMFVSGVSIEILQRLIDAGFKVVDFAPGSGTFGFERIKPIVAFLNEHSQEYRNVVWTDWPDVVFQSDPSIWLENHLVGGYKLVGCTDSVTIENGGGTDEWVKRVSPEVFERIKRCDVCCCGTLAGESQALRDLLHNMHRMLSTDMSLIDQGVLNFLLRISPFKEITLFPKLEDGFVGGLVQFLGGRTNVWTNPHPRLDEETGLVYPFGKDTPFVLLHQHNRNVAWWRCISSRYTEDVPSIVSFPPDDRRKQPVPQVVRPLRAPRRLR